MIDFINLFLNIQVVQNQEADLEAAVEAGQDVLAVDHVSHFISIISYIFICCSYNVQVVPDLVVKAAVEASPDPEAEAHPTNLEVDQVILL